MGETPPFSVGDWLRFYRNGGLVIAAVEYVRKAPQWPNPWEAVTNAGVVTVDAIVERRPAPPTGHGSPGGGG